MYEKLPHDIASRHVLLLDPILATGNSADRAIQVLLERGVPQDNILFLNLIATPQGIHNICSKYPEVTLRSAPDMHEYHLVAGGCCKEQW